MHFDGAKQRMSVMAGPDGRALMRKFSDLAKARQAQRAARRGAPVPGQVKLEEVEDDGEPFDDKMTRLTGELAGLFEKSHELEQEIREKLGAIGYEV